MTKQQVLEEIKELVFEMYTLCQNDWKYDDLDETEWNKWLNIIQETVSYRGVEKLIFEEIEKVHGLRKN